MREEFGVGSVEAYPRFVVDGAAGINAERVAGEEKQSFGHEKASKIQPSVKSDQVHRPLNSNKLRPPKQTTQLLLCSNPQPEQVKESAQSKTYVICRKVHPYERRRRSLLNSVGYLRISEITQNE